MQPIYHKRIKEVLPKNRKILNTPEAVDVPGETIWPPVPPSNQIMVKGTKKFLWVIPLWETVGEVDAVFDMIFLSDAYYEKYEPRVVQILKNAGLEGEVVIRKGESFSSKRFREFCDSPFVSEID